MLRKWKLTILILALALVAVFCTTAMAEDAVIANDRAIVTVLDGNGTTASFNAVNSEILDITVTSEALQDGIQYLIMMVQSEDGETYAVTEDSILYIDQKAAEAVESTGLASVSFAVYPSDVKNSIIMINGGDGTSLKIATVEEAPAIEKFTLAGMSMTLGNDLTMNFFAYAADVTGDGWYAEFVREGKTTVVPMEDWVFSGSMYRIPYTGVAAKEMVDEVEVTLYNAKGQAVSETWTDSIRAYGVRMAQKTSTKLAMRTTLVDMLNYGAAAQTYFNYKADDLANNQLTADLQALATQSVTLQDIRVKGTGYMGSSLELKTNIELKFFYPAAYAGKTAVITYTDHYNKAHTYEYTLIQNGSYATVSVNTLVVADCSVPVTCTVDGVASVDSVESYCYRMSSTLELAEPLMKFAVSARAAFQN